MTLMITSTSTTTSLLILMPLTSLTLTPSAVTTYLFLCLLAAGGLLAVAVDLWRSRTTRAGRLALAVVGCVLGWLLSVICSLLSPTASLALFWHGTVRFVFVVLLPPLIILYFVCYFGIPRLSRQLVIGVSLIPGLTILFALTNGVHHWFLAVYTMQRVGPYFVRASWVPGPWFPIYAVFISGSMLAVVVALALAYQRRQPLYRAQLGVMGLALVLPSALILFDTVSRSPLALLGTAPLGFAATALLLAWGLRHLRVLDLVPAAREAIFAGMTDPVLVLDTRGRVIDLNPAAEQLLGRSAETVLGAAIKALLPGQLADLHDPQAQALPIAEGKPGPAAGAVASTVATLDLECDQQTRRLDVRLSAFGLGAKRVDGHLLVLRDVTALKQAEAHLAEQASELQTIFEALADGVAVFDLEGHCVRANPALRDLLGLDADREYASRPLEERTQRLLLFDEQGQPLPPAQWPLRLALRGEILAGASAVEAAAQIGDRRERWISTTGAPMRGPDGQIIGAVLITRDVTARRALEQQVAKQTSQLEAIFAAMADGMLVHDLQGTVLRVNQAHRELIGMEVDPDFFTRPQSERIQRLRISDEQGHPIPNEGSASRRVLRGEVLKGPSAAYVLMHTLDGRELWVSIAGAPMWGPDGQITGVVLISRDVTARRALEQQVQEQASELEAIFETQADGVAVFDVQGCFVRANPALRDLLGLDADREYASRSLDERAQQLLFFDEHDQLLTAEQWPHWRVLRGEILAGASAMEGRVRALDGRERWISTTGAPMRGPDGQIIGAVLITRDVTARRALEQQMAEQAAAAERTRLAHELHDTVTQEIYSAGLLAESITRNWHEHRADAEAALAQLPAVIRGALAGLRVLLLELRPTTLEQLPLSALLRQLAEAMSTRVKVPIAVSMRLTGRDGNESGSEGATSEGAEPPLPVAVKVVFYRVAQEALMNAAKYAKAHAISVQLRTCGQGRSRGKARDSDRFKGERGTIELEIADDGQGFDPSAISAGHFGLAIMRERAHAVGATVQVHSRPGQGTRIVVAWRGERQAGRGDAQAIGRRAAAEGGTA